jgi:hypothetical protein
MNAPFSSRWQETWKIISPDKHSWRSQRQPHGLGMTTISNDQLTAMIDTFKLAFEGHQEVSSLMLLPSMESQHSED